MWYLIWCSLLGGQGMVWWRLAITAIHSVFRCLLLGYWHGPIIGFCYPAVTDIKQHQDCCRKKPFSLTSDSVKSKMLHKMSGWISVWVFGVSRWLCRPHGPWALLDTEGLDRYWPEPTGVGPWVWLCLEVDHWDCRKDTKSVGAIKSCKELCITIQMSSLFMQADGSWAMLKWE